MNTKKESLWYRMNKSLAGHMMNKRLGDYVVTFIEDYVFAPVTFLLVSFFGLIIIALAIAFMIAVMFASSPAHGAARTWKPPKPRISETRPQIDYSIALDHWFRHGGGRLTPEMVRELLKPEAQPLYRGWEW